MNEEVERTQTTDVDVLAEMQEAIDGYEAEISKLMDEAATPMEPTARLSATLALRRILTAGRDGFKKMVELLDDQAKLFMIMNGYDVNKFEDEVQGYSLKISNGKNLYIGEKEVRLTLESMEFNPDQIDWFISEVQKVTLYDYIDMRRLSVKEQVETVKKTTKATKKGGN